METLNLFTLKEFQCNEILNIYIQKDTKMMKSEEIEKYLNKFQLTKNHYILEESY